MSLWHKQREQISHGENGGEKLLISLKTSSLVSLWVDLWNQVSVCRAQGVCRARRMEWAITMQSGKQRDRFYGDRWSQSGHTNAKTKRWMEFMALSSGGQLWLKQSRQMSRKTTSKHELIRAERPSKNFELKRTRSQESLSDSFYMAFWATVRRRQRLFLSKCWLHISRSLQAKASSV